MTRTLWEVLGAITDRRGRKGRQLPLPAILAIAICAMLAGANDLRAIFRWGRRLTPEALALFGIERAPCHREDRDPAATHRQGSRAVVVMPARPVQERVGSQGDSKNRTFRQLTRRANQIL